MSHSIMMNNISVVVPYHKNKYGLVYVLTMLQNQTVKPDQIIIIDTSPDKSGLDIAQMLSYNDIPIIVEVAGVNVTKAWNKGISLADDKNHILIINDDIIFPINFIATLQYSIMKNPRALVHVPKSSTREHVANYITTTFEASPSGGISFEETDWMTGFCYLLTRQCIEKVGVLNEELEIWFSDDDYQGRVLKYAKDENKVGIIKIMGTFVYHFGGRSYRYKSKQTLDIIKKDRKKFLKS